MASVDDAAYAAAREVLRYRDHPQRRAADDDEALVRALNRELRDTIAAMPERHSQLLRRCDLEGEPYRAVMHALALSERHFYRERRAAIVDLGHRLTQRRAGERARPAVSVGRDRLSLGLAQADALERAGRTDDALGLLSSIRAGVAQHDAVRLDVRLAEVNRDAGRFGTAALHARLARERPNAGGGDGGDTDAELDSLAATIAWQAGEVACQGHDTFAGNLDRLRARTGQQATALIPHALSDALEMSAESVLEAGDWSRALALFEEAHASLERALAPRNDVLVRSLIWVATARSWVAGGLPVAAAELERAYALAVRAEALWRNGQEREGAAQMHQALDLMARYAHPLRLAAQYRRAARVTGDRRHLRLGREIWHAHAARIA